MGPEGNYAFFPLLPLLLRGARALAGHRGALAILLAANVALSAAAAVGLHALARRLGAPPWPSVLLLLTFPAAVFQSALYTESILLCLSVGAALCAGSGRLSLGEPLGYLAGLTRPQGLLVSALWTGCLRRPRSSPSGPRRSRLQAILALAAPVAGMATFSLVLALKIGSPLGFLGIQSHWAREFSPAHLLGEVLSPWSYKGPPLDYVALILGVGLTPWLWRRLPPPLALYGTLSVLLPLSTGTMLSLGRFLSVSFPHFLCLAKLLEGRRVATGLVLAGFIVLQCLMARGLVGWYFVG
jgi:hypothetical protein